MSEPPIPLVYEDSTVQAELVEAVKSSPAEAIVEAWFAETFHGLPLAVEYFNRFAAAKDELKKRLAALKE